MWAESTWWPRPHGVRSTEGTPHPRQEDGPHRIISLFYWPDEEEHEGQLGSAVAQQAEEAELQVTTRRRRPVAQQARGPLRPLKEQQEPRSYSSLTAGAPPLLGPPIRNREAEPLSSGRGGAFHRGASETHYELWSLWLFDNL